MVLSSVFVLRVTFLTAGILVCLSPGCSRKSPTGVVSGKVTHNAQPVTEGIISFCDEKKGLVAAMNLGPGGEYDLRFAGGRDVPVGEYVVTVIPPEPNEPIGVEVGKAPPRADTRQWPNFPVKYRSPNTSPLTATVEEGKNHFDFELKD